MTNTTTNATTNATTNDKKATATTNANTLTARADWRSDYPLVETDLLKVKKVAAETALGAFVNALKKDSAFSEVSKAEKELSEKLSELNDQIQDDYLLKLSTIESHDETCKKFIETKGYVTKYILSAPNKAHPDEYLIYASGRRISYDLANKKAGLSDVEKSSLDLNLNSFMDVLTMNIASKSNGVDATAIVYGNGDKAVTKTATSGHFKGYSIRQLKASLNFVVERMFPSIDVKLVEADVKFILHGWTTVKTTGASGIKTFGRSVLTNLIVEAIFVRMNHLRYEVTANHTPVAADKNTIIAMMREQAAAEKAAKKSAK